MFLKERVGFEAEPVAVKRKIGVLDIIAWLEARPGCTEYDYGQPDDCLLTRFFQECVDPAFNSMAERRHVETLSLPFYHYYPSYFTWEEEQRLMVIAKRRPYTYAAALERARAFVREARA